MTWFWNIYYIILALPGLAWRASQRLIGHWWAARYH